MKSQKKNPKENYQVSKRMKTSLVVEIKKSFLDFCNGSWRMRDFLVKSDELKQYWQRHGSEETMESVVGQSKIQIISITRD